MRMNPLYKYQKFDPNDHKKIEWLRELLSTGNVHCSAYSAMNDPMEGVFEYVSIGNEDMRHAIEGIRYGKINHKIGCLTRSYQHNLMWAYYADGHQGICVEVDDIYEPKNNYKRFDIKYSHQMPLVTNRMSVDDAIIKILTTKSKQWKHEKEVRFLVNDGDVLHAHIRRVFAGCKMSQENYEKLRKLVAEINEPRSSEDQIKVLRLQRENVDYGWSTPVDCD